MVAMHCGVVPDAAGPEVQCRVVAEHPACRGVRWQYGGGSGLWERQWCSPKPVQHSGCPWLEIAIARGTWLGGRWMLTKRHGCGLPPAYGLPRGDTEAVVREGA